MTQEARAAKATLTRRVYPAMSVNNIFDGIGMAAVNVGMAANGWSIAHQDPYSSDSVGVDGPTGNLLQMQSIPNPHGGMMVMTCNTNGALIGTSVKWDTSEIYLTVYDSQNMTMIGEQLTGLLPPASFRGGYFFLDHENNAVTVNSDGTISRYSTASFSIGDPTPPAPITELWKTPIISLIDQGADERLYGVIPVGDSTNNPSGNIFWVVTTTDYDPARIMSITVGAISVAANGVVTQIGNSLHYTNEWNNNTLTADDSGLYIITSGTGAAATLTGHCRRIVLGGSTVSAAWDLPYPHVNYIKMGMTNTGSGTTVTLMDHAQTGEKLVMFCDNADPQTSVIVYKGGNTSSPTLVGTIPVFKPMRSATEASPVGVNNTIIVTSNFGHTIDRANSEPQAVPNEPGVACVRINDACDALELAWEAALPINTSFGMAQLSRSSGILFVFSGSWLPDTASDATSAPQTGPHYFISAYDSWDGRIIWQVPVGTGYDSVHEYGGLYFDRIDSTGTSTSSLYVGTNGTIVKVSSQELP